MQESQKVFSFSGAKANTGLSIVLQSRIDVDHVRDPGLIVVEYFVQAVESSIVHVRAGIAKVAETGHFESIEITCHFGERHSAGIFQFTQGQSDVSKTVVGEQWLSVAGIAFVLKNLVACSFLCRKCCLPFFHTVVFGVVADQHDHVL